jgi:chromosome segregation ATPase
MLYARQDSPDECKTALKQAAGMSGPAATEAQAILTKTDAWIDARKKYQDAIAQVKDQVGQSEGKLKQVNVEGQAAVASKVALKRDYDSQCQPALDEYNRRMADINNQYNQEIPPASLQKTNAGDYNNRMNQANANRQSRQNDARANLDQRYADIDRAFRPRVDEVNTQIATLEQQAVALMREQADLKAKLTTMARKDQQPAPPFDPLAELKGIARGAWGSDAATTRSGS